MLKDLINWNKIMSQPRYAGGHEEIMKNLFKNAKVIASYIENNYQGIEGFIYKLPDQYVIVSDYFGSCSGCDEYDSCSDKELKNLCIQLANNAHSFSTLNEVVNFLSNDVKQDKGTYYDLYDLAQPLLDELRKNVVLLRQEKLKSFNF